MPEITPKQKALIEFIYKFSRENSYAPSQLEIAAHFGWRSLGTVQDYVKKLTQKGILLNRPNARRALQLNPSYEKMFSENFEIQAIPIVGKIAAGSPIEAVQQTSPKMITVPKSMLPPGEFFTLEVEGKSMIEEGILPGDYIVVKKDSTAIDGETVVALLENDATIKKLYHHGEKIELRPANQRMKSIWVNANQCCIQGVVIGLYRRYK